MKKQQMETQVRMQEEFAVVDVRGEVNGVTGPELKKVILDATGLTPHVLVNMRDVALMDSSGLGTLIGAVSRLRPGTLHLYGCNNRIQRLLEITGLNRVFDVHVSEEEAMAHARTADNLRSPVSPAAPVSATAATAASATVRADEAENRYSLPLTGRVAIITGGAGGVGRTVTMRWLQAGASVLVASHAAPALTEIQAAWASAAAGQSGAAERLATVAADVATAEGAAHMVATAQQAFGKSADTLMHLVGGFAMGPLDAPDAPATWEKMMTLNLTSAFHCYRAVLPALRARGGGWIVGLGSRAAVQPPARMAAYAASKAGLTALTQSLAAEVRGENIHVNLILASTIDTPANRKSIGDGGAEGWVRPDDIADATLYLGDVLGMGLRAVHGATLEIYAKA